VRGRSPLRVGLYVLVRWIPPTTLASQNPPRIADEETLDTLHVDAKLRSKINGAKE
jgi:hypothetical protein